MSLLSDLQHIEQDERVSMSLNGDLYFSHAVDKDSRRDYCCFAAFPRIRTIVQKTAMSVIVKTSKKTLSEVYFWEHGHCCPPLCPHLNVHPSATLFSYLCIFIFASFYLGNLFHVCFVLMVNILLYVSSIFPFSVKKDTSPEKGRFFLDVCAQTSPGFLYKHSCIFGKYVKE